MIKNHLEDWVKQTAVIGFPAILENFVLRNGTEFKNVLSLEECAQKLGLKKRKAKECFKNATDLALYNSAYTYVEGYAIREDLGLLIHHAWVIDKDQNVIDLTWDDPEDCHYMGIAIEDEILRKQIIENGYYGLFTGSCMINLDFLLKLDPKLRDLLPKRFGEKI